MRPARTTAILGLVLGAMALAGCSRTVAVEEPQLSGAPAEVCANIVADVPEQVMDQPRRRTEPGIASAAWGSPPITLRCGVPQPADLARDSECVEVNNVGWFAEPGSGGTIFTTIGRDVFVEVGVPADYAPEAGALTFFSEPIEAHNPARQPCV